MSGYSFTEEEKKLFAGGNFEIDDLQSEIRVDHLCQELLQRFRHALEETDGLMPEQAGFLAHGADYFLRDFVISDRQENIFRLRPGRVRQFAGNWYIVRNLEPNMAELEGILQGVATFYTFCAGIGHVDGVLAEAVRQEASLLEYYRQRIDDFLAIEGDGYFAWERECSLKGQQVS